MPQIQNRLPCCCARPARPRGLEGNGKQEGKLHSPEHAPRTASCTQRAAALPGTHFSGNWSTGDSGLRRNPVLVSPRNDTLQSLSHYLCRRTEEILAPAQVAYHFSPPTNPSPNASSRRSAGTSCGSPSRKRCTTSSSTPARPAWRCNAPWTEGRLSCAWRTTAAALTRKPAPPRRRVGRVTDWKTCAAAWPNWAAPVISKAVPATALESPFACLWTEPPHL